MSIAAFKQWGRSKFPHLWNFATYGYWRLRLSNQGAEPLFFQQTRALGRQRRANGSAAGKDILFFASRQERDQVAIVSTLGWALERRGHKVSVLSCDRALLHSCNTGAFPELSPWICRACHLYVRKTRELDGIPTLWLGDVISEGAEERASAMVATLSPGQYEAFVYREYPVGHMVRHSVAHFLRTGNLTDDPRDMEVYRHWLISGIWLVDVCEEILDQRRPDVVVLLNGLFAPEWIMMEAARRRGIRMVAWEVGVLPETFFFQPDRPTDITNNEYWPQYRDIPLTTEENARLDRYFATRRTGGGYLVNYFPNMREEVDQICSEYGIDRNRKIAVLFPNITWDSALFEKDVAFAGLDDWLKETIDYFAARPGSQLVIRVHPAEAVFRGASRDSVINLIDRLYPERPANLIVIPPGSGISSYVLMDLADCGIVYGSTTGMEMGVRGTPVIVCGQIYYRGHGFTLDPETKDAFRQMLDDVLSGAIPRDDPETIEAWRRYAHFVIFRTSIGISQIRYRLMGESIRLRFDELEALDPGRDANLDVICSGITDGTPFIAAKVDEG